MNNIPEKEWTINANRSTIGVTITNPNATFYDIEEIIAMILRDAKDLAKRAAKEEVVDCVVSVPPQFGIREKMALLDALRLANLNPLGLINENLGAAVRYAIDRNNAASKANNTSNRTIVMYVNFGASSFKVSVVNHSTIVDPVSRKKD